MGHRLVKPIDLDDLGKHPRILVNIEEWLKAHPLKSGVFSHYRPARYVAENISALGVCAAEKSMRKL